MDALGLGVGSELEVFMLPSPDSWFGDVKYLLQNIERSR